MHDYQVAGLRVRSEIELPELLPDEAECGEPDVEIRHARVPRSLPLASQSTAEAEISDGDVLIRVPDTARYLVRDGRQILIQAASEARDRDLRLFLLGSAFGAVYLQRGFFPLHASVVVMDGRAMAFSGDSGAGKSTIAAWLNTRGYPLLCDDVCVIRFDGKDRPVVYPGFPRLKLWKDALQAFDMNPDELQRDYSRADKYHLSVPGGFRTDPVPLDRIFILRFPDGIARPQIDDIGPAQAVPLLRDNTYRFQYISGLGLTRSHFLDCVRLARSTTVQYLDRPRHHSALAECQRLLEKLRR